MADDNEEDLVLDLNKLEKPDDEGDKSDPVVAPKPPPVPGPTTAASQDGLKDLETQIREGREERDRIAAENRQLQQRAERAEAFAQEAERRGISQQELLFDNQITSAQEQMDTMAEQYATALENQDFRLAGDIQKKSNRLGGQLAIAEANKARFADQRNRPPQQQRPQTQEQEPTDPLERAIKRFSDPTKQFLRRHPDLVRSDGTLKRVAVTAHEDALDKDLVADSDAYFRHIEAALAGQAPRPEAPAAPAAPRAAPSYAAPVAREAAPGATPGTFRMTPAMRRLAAEQGVTPQEWAQGFLRGKKEGKIPADWVPT